MKHVYPTIESCIGNTPLVRLQRMCSDEVPLLVKLEGNNPAGSVKDRPAMSMLQGAIERGEIKPGDRLIEATSGNTGIALAMAAAIRAYRLTLIMPDDVGAERHVTMKAFGAEVILVRNMEEARDLAAQMREEGKGIGLDQFANPDNPLAHYETTGPEIWRDTHGTITHFVSSMGTTGTIMGAGRFFKEKNPEIEIIGVEPTEGSRIPGIRRWAPEYLPKIFEPERVDRTLEVSRQQAQDTMCKLASEEGIFCGISSGGCVHAALRVVDQARESGGQSIVVAVICDRGDRYISTGVFPT